MSRPPVAVLGASGQVGRFLLPLLAREGAPVLALSRTGRPAAYPGLPGVEWLGPGPQNDTRQMAPEALVSAGPIQLALEFLHRYPGVRRIVVVSSSSVHAKLASPDAAERALVTSLARAERSVVDHCRERGVACTVLRPTLLYGAGMDENLTRLLRWIERFGWLPIARDADGLRQPLHVADLAEACVRALDEAAPSSLESPLCGGSTLAYRDMVMRLFEVAGRPVRLLRLPVGVLAGAVALASRTPWLKGANTQMVRRQAVDLVFDDRLARAGLGIAPRPFEPEPADFLPPDAASLKGLLDRRPP